MKMALYRKWRSKKFADVVGQSAVVDALRNQIKSGRFSHAYIFTGVRGTGKTTFAKIIAKAVNCPDAVDGEPCGVCHICRGIDDGSILDVTEIDAASNNGVDNIRDICEETAFAPTVCRFRVYIIDEVHMLSTGAFNALLKTIEEPPAHVIFILATTEIHKVPATILSRCQRFDLKRISVADIKKHIMYVAKEEGIDLREDGAELIARLADGAMRDALSLLDTCASLGGEINEEVVSRLAGVVDKSYLFDITEYIKNKDVPRLFAKLSELYRDSLDATRLCTEMLRHTRNLFMLKVSSDAVLNDCSAEAVKRYKAQSATLSCEQLTDMLDALGEVADKLGKTPDKMLSLELCFIKLCGDARSQKPVEVKPTAVVPSAPAFVPEPVPVVAPTSAAKPAAAEKEEEKPAAQEGELAEWSRIVELLKDRNMMLYSLLKKSRAFLTDKFVLIDADELFLAHIRDNSESKEAIKSAIFEVTGKRLPIGPYKGTAAAKPKDTADKKLDDLISRAKDGGVEVEIK